ncbi:hypothetical protein RirG_106520 [Rhizophagus irregularis DAOM 197198w]|uniref:Zinc finger bed domain-containing protein ricesleeper 2-like n=1 Tax=Rhizophagus irregularis (strain DAOM 197198w) TaxID=1432141 RepID=A0A015KL96_RHIIW|nr:hypothetical protein RirG_106520 [Rhizophagus irregularis DAOM 197198w]
MWTSTISSEAYFSLTIHYIDQNWVLRHFLLDIIPFKVRHTGINMAAAITNILNEFNLAGKTLALTTDNEFAMLVCGRRLSEEFEKELNNLTFSHYCYSVHILNLAVKQGMEIVDQEIVEVRQLMSKIKNSVLLCNELHELCIIEKLEYLRPEIDIETSYSEWKMLAAKHDSMHELMPDVEAWTKIKETMIILEPLERATKNLSGSLYPTIADVRFYFNEICDHLKYCVERKDGFGQYMLAASINEKLKEYWLIIDNHWSKSILSGTYRVPIYQ